MSLADKLDALKPVYKPRFEQYVDSLPEKDKTALLAAANDPAWSTAALLRVLQDDGVSVGKEALGSWRRNVSRR